MRALLRVVDATSNRAAEALRTLEDLLRFARGDGPAARALKSLRHELRETVRPIGGASTLALLASRDAAGDPGAPAADAASRGSVPDVAQAASSRCGEALRSLEEALRVVDPSIAARVERLRYRAYDATAAAVLALSTGRARQWRVCVLLTERLCRRPWAEVLASIVEAGVDCIQVREKEDDGASLLARVRRVIDLAGPHGVAVVVNDRADVALAAGADGVQVGQGDLPPREIRSLGGSLLIGVSTHSIAEAEAAIDAGADLCGVGSMFATAEKPDLVPSGPAYLRAFVRRWPDLPHLAIGGVTPERLPELVEAGCRGVAVSSAVCAAADPGAVVAALRTALEVGAPA